MDRIEIYNKLNRIKPSFKSLKYPFNFWTPDKIKFSQKEIEIKFKEGDNGKQWNNNGHKPWEKNKNQHNNNNNNNGHKPWEKNNHQHNQQNKHNNNPNNHHNKHNDRTVGGDNQRIIVF